MSLATPDVLDRLRRPEYVGENRCVPCTVVNVAIALLASAAVWAGGRAVAVEPVGLGAAGGLLAVSLAAIYLRGYLVPGTPTLTKRYLPERVLRWFEKAPAEVTAPVAGSSGDVDAEPVLMDAGVIELCEGGEDLCATDAFAAAWREEIEALRDGTDLDERLAEVLETDPEAIEVDVREGFTVVRIEDGAVARWESEAALLADAAAARPLAERVDDWDRLDLRDRGQLLNGARVFLERCPSCDGAVDFSEETRESCCRSVDVVALECTDCGAVLLEVET